MEMSFSIDFINVPLEYLGDDATTPSAVGQIILGDFEESFVFSLFAWSVAQYRIQWRHAIQKLLDGANKSALIAEYVGLNAGTHCNIWSLYRDEQTVHVQNRLLFYSQMSKTFVPELVDEFIGDRKTTTEDGQAISEWDVPLQDIEAFAQSMTW